MASSNKKNKNKSSASSKSSTKTVKQQAPKPKQRPKERPVGLLLAALILAIMTAFVYKGALDNEFVDWDDYTYVTENNLVRSGTDLTAFTQLKGSKRSISASPSPHTSSIKNVFTTVVALNYHPLTVLTMRWNNNACPTCPEGISARPFIFWNIVLHVLNSLLVLLLIYHLSKKNLLISIFVAAIFAFHPMHVESVAWVSERKDVLYSFFFLLGLLSYWNYLQKNAKKWLYGAFLLFILSCLSKAMAVVFPLVMLLLYFWNSKSAQPIEALKESLKPAALIPTLPFFACSVLFGAIAMNVQAGGNWGGLLERGTTAVAMNSFEDFKLMERIQFASYGFIQYILHFFLPTNLSTFYPYPDQQTFNDSLFFKAAPIFMTLILGAALASLKFTKSIALGIGFYLITVVLVLQFVSVGTVIMADRYTYLPYIGLAFLLAMLVHEFAPQKAKKGALIALIAVACLYIPKTISQIEIWQNSERLWTNVIDLNKTEDNLVLPTMARPLGIRGNYYGKRADKATTPNERQVYLDKAFKDFVIAAKLGSKNASVYEGIGSTYGIRGNMKQEQARQLQQKNKTQEAQRFAKEAKENLNLAIQNYSKAIELEPNRGTSYFNRGVTYSILRIHDKAISDYTKTLQFAPEQAPRTHMNRGISYAAMRQNQKAIADFQQVLRYNPKDDIAQRYLKQLTRK
ncbi:MAG: Tetratricopeptide (TPR) repeat protein [uncultured Aureispira sp.]|uniref:Tetratricopeptide (TPR) repeat protein n=1 Tax=uncultured Aureispira sp. TaxID=1331704 RepID=A0A6S6UCA3_9BACT|nr:MAG: Tetratricopeptide (TPR) repeat protein [uncultured Aureispira sp.]